MFFLTLTVILYTQIVHPTSTLRKWLWLFPDLTPELSWNLNKTENEIIKMSWNALFSKTEEMSDSADINALQW